MTVFQDHLCNDPTEGFFSAKPTHSHAVFTLWVYIPTYLPLSHLFCSHLPRKLVEVTSLIAWHIQCMLAIAFKAARVMQTLEVWADTKSCRDISRLFKDCLVYFMNGMGLRMGNSISPCFFCFWRGGVGQAIINSFITYTGQCPPILTSCNAECSYVLFHDQLECVQEVKVKSDFTLPVVRVCHHYHYKLWSRSSYSVSVCLFSCLFL